LKDSNKVYDIKIRCYGFSKSVVLFLNKYEFKRIHYSIINQFLRSATSIGANVIEGKSGNSKRNLMNLYQLLYVQQMKLSIGFILSEILWRLIKVKQVS
jgi:hypothetical protein